MNRYRRLLILLMQFVIVSSTFAQGFDTEQWMKGLDDDMLVSSLSIPGAHDAATGEGVCFFPGLGVTQTLDLREQWRCGVRAFDLRPAVRDTLLYIYHGRQRTKVTFAEALDIIISQLHENPSEFAVVLLREETDSENEKERALWPALIGKVIRNIGDRAVVFHPYMKLVDVRGKVLFLTRNAYKCTEKGAFVSGWSHSKDGTIAARIKSYANDGVARLQMQDYYAPTDNVKRAEKLNAVKRLLTLAENAPAGVWTINFLSGYATTWLGFTPLATTSGYKRNAAWLHPVVLEFLGKERFPMGIVFMDYAGVDKVGGGLWHWKPFEVHGKMLLEAIVESNLRK